MALACLWIALAVLAFGSTGWRAVARLAPSLPVALEGVDLQLTGIVARLPQVGAQGTRFVFDVEQTTFDGQAVTVPPRVSMGWYRGADVQTLMADAAPDLRAGQRWQLTARLRQPHGSLNPHGFDFELWLFEQGIRASGTVRTGEGASTRRLAEDVAHPVERARQPVRDAMLLREGNAQAAGVLAALAVGDQAAIDRDDWDLFRHTGVAHLMSISGLHVTMFAWLAALITGVLWRLSGRLMLALPAPLAARWGGVLVAVGYALLAGWGVPAQRTLWMLVTVALLRSTGLRWPPPLVLLAAAVVVTVFDPWALTQPGFWLSFAAVGFLMLAEPSADGALRRDGGRWAAIRQTLRAGLRTQAVASIGLAPLSLVFFQQVSRVGFVANLVAIPLVTLAIVPLSLLGVLLPPLWAVASLLVQGLVLLLGWLAEWPHGVWSAAAAPLWGIASGLLGGVLLLMPLPWRLRLLGVCRCCCPCWLRPSSGRRRASSKWWWRTSARGPPCCCARASTCFFTTPGRVTASRPMPASACCCRCCARGETRIDLLMLSHRDTDHVGGAASLLAQTEVRALSTSLPPEHQLRAGGRAHQRCAAGQSWAWDGVSFKVLHPQPTDHALQLRPKALSCVLRVQSATGASLLLTGDIEAAQEAALVARLGRSLRSQVLLVPRHGSRTSSTDTFIEAVAPGTAVVQAAYRNRFGHPAPEVEARYRALGVEWLRSDRCGAWSWSSDGASHCEREAAARYWHHHADADVISMR